MIFFMIPYQKMKVQQKSPSRTTCAYDWDTYREIWRRECASRPAARARFCGKFCPQGDIRDCEAEPLPAAETGEAEQGPRSVFCKGAATPAAKAGNRNQRNFCRAYARRNGFPLKRVVFDTLKKTPQGKPCGAFALLVLQQLFRDCREMADYSTSCRAA